MQSANALIVLPKDGMPSITLSGTRPARAAIALRTISRDSANSTDRRDPRCAQVHDAYRRAGLNGPKPAPRLLAVA